MKTVLLIDGENFKYYIKSVLGHNNIDWYKYDFKSLFDLVLDGYDVNEVIFYFAKIKFHKNTEEKSIELIENQRRLKTSLEQKGFKVIFAGRVRGYEEKGVLVFKEKGVDVRIGVDMASFSFDKKFNQVILGSSDSDLQPAINELKKRGGQIVYLGFEKRPNKGISYNCNKTILIRDSEINKFLID